MRVQSPSLEASQGESVQPGTGVRVGVRDVRSMFVHIIGNGYSYQGPLARTDAVRHAVATAVPYAVRDTGAMHEPALPYSPACQFVYERPAAALVICSRAPPIKTAAATVRGRQRTSGRQARS
eukprot:scaffold66479_cov31-Prasinocladus_malaysianus.AAC.2